MPDEPKNEPKRKLKLVAYCDGPLCFSGFAQVSRNILGLLHETGLFDIKCFAINHYCERDDFGRFLRPDVPYEVLEASFITSEDRKKGYDIDFYGQAKLMKLLYQEDFDVLWSVQDPYVVSFLGKTFSALKNKVGKKFKSVLYFPVDAVNASAEWCIGPNFFDYPVVYTEFGEKVVNDRINDYISNPNRDKSIAAKLESYRKKLRVIHHGTNVDDFFPMAPEKKREIRKKLEIKEDACVVLNVSRNQPRKDLARTLHVFSEFKKKVKNSVLILYCQAVDIGGDLRKIMPYYGLMEGVDVIFPEIPNNFKGSDISQVNQAYNAADIVINTTLGEGWGLPLTEAMACKVPAIFPSNTSINEIIGNEERGFLVKCGETKTEWVHLPTPNGGDEPPRPLTNVEDMIDKMLYVWENRGEPAVLDKVEAAYQWVQERTWKKIFDEKWLPIFTEIHDELTK